MLPYGHKVMNRLRSIIEEELEAVGGQQVGIFFFFLFFLSIFSFYFFFLFFLSFLLFLSVFFYLLKTHSFFYLGFSPSLAPSFSLG